jgi:hypothetical protein
MFSRLPHKINVNFRRSIDRHHGVQNKGMVQKTLE